MGYLNESGAALAIRRALRWLKSNNRAANPHRSLPKPPGHIASKLELARETLG